MKESYKSETGRRDMVPVAAIVTFNTPAMNPGPLSLTLNTLTSVCVMVPIIPVPDPAAAPGDRTVVCNSLGLITAARTSN